MTASPLKEGWWPKNVPVGNIRERSGGGDDGKVLLSPRSSGTQYQEAGGHQGTTDRLSWIASMETLLREKLSLLISSHAFVLEARPCFPLRNGGQIPTKANIHLGWMSDEDIRWGERNWGQIWPQWGERAQWHRNKCDRLLFGTSRECMNLFCADYL